MERSAPEPGPRSWAELRRRRRLTRTTTESAPPVTSVRWLNGAARERSADLLVSSRHLNPRAANERYRPPPPIPRHQSVRHAPAPVGAPVVVRSARLPVVVVHARVRPAL